MRRQQRAQHALRHELNRHVQRGGDGEGEKDGARHSVRRVVDLAARRQRNLDARIRKYQDQRGPTDGITIGNPGPHQGRPVDEEHADADKNQERRQLCHRDRLDEPCT